MSTKITVKGQVTLPKAVRDAAGIRVGDRVVVRARAQGGVIVEMAAPHGHDEDYLKRLEDMIHRKPFAGCSTEEALALTRSEV